jgi:hypothetical protein
MALLQSPLTARELNRDTLPNTAHQNVQGSPRQPELDALRGFLLIWMTPDSSSHSRQLFH